MFSAVVIRRGGRLVRVDVSPYGNATETAAFISGINKNDFKGRRLLEVKTETDAGAGDYLLDKVSGLYLPK